MDRSVCCKCIEDAHLRKLVDDEAEGKDVECAVCGEAGEPTVTVERLGQLLEPIMREHFVVGPSVKKFGENDSEWWEQEGDPIAYWVQEVLGQYFDFEDAIVRAVIDADEYWPGDGGEAYWDDTSMYVPKRVQTHQYFADWHYTLNELKHGRRFFSPSARALFDKLFDGVDDLKAWTGRRFIPVVRRLSMGTKVYRARVCGSRSLLKDILEDPLKHVGPPPTANARAGRMNAEGVVVCYGARDPDTCLAEMRPALGVEVALIAMETTRPLRVLDFSRLDHARGGKALSYFQGDYTDQVERRTFLRRLHGLISQPIVPGHEADYMITQTMAEYLAHVHARSFDGVLFASVQRAGGTNIVLFPDKGLLTDQPADAFGLRYVEKSLKLMSTTSIRYRHQELDIGTDGGGDPWVSKGGMQDFDEDWT